MLHPQTVPQAAVLMRSDVDNRPQWQPGERLHHLFEQRCDALQAQGLTSQLAVDSATHRLTYAELDAMANRLARHLLQLGHRSGDVLALLFDKSAHSYAAMLAVLKIHAAYVPLDAGFPADRIAFMLADAGVGRVLSMQAHRNLLDDAAAGAAAASATVAVTCLDDITALLQGLPGHRLTDAELAPPASEMCYVIYTSGSTGRPKGVPIDHGQIVNFVRVAASTYGLRADDRVYQGLTLAFDFAVEEIWVPLVLGATLLPNQTGGSLLGDDLAHFLKEHRATAMCCVPTLLATLEADLPLLRLLIVSGEACPRDLVARWHRPGLRFLNAYGPTEATVTATLGHPVPGKPVTIGQPLPSYAIVILAPGEARALAFGEPGEIGIAGAGVARGYLNRDEQTRQAFIDDFIGVAHNTSGRIYRTGDLGRINADGEVEYLGRIDTQVKIRGYRIELAEIESVLLQQPGVAQAVVNTWQSSPGVSELVAYYTVQPGATGDAVQPDGLAQRLREVLPSYMVPAFYEPLASMPMLASDKADRKALPPPARQRLHDQARPFAAPQGPLEATIATEISQLLGLDQVSADDHFFHDLGAHSLLLAQLSARLRQALGQEALSMRDLYAQPSVRALAAFVASLPAALPATSQPEGASGAASAEPAPHVASRAAYLGCGLAQALLALAFLWAHGAAWWHGWHWLLEAQGALQTYSRTVLFSAGYFLASAAVPIGLKWLLVGRWRAQTIPVWSLAYLRFWAVKTLVRSNPLVLFAGTPLFVLYLRLLGARVAWSAQVGLTQTPVCTDLLQVGEGAVIGALCHVPCYQAVGGRIRTGPVRIGAGCHVGEGAFVDIDTRMADGTRLAHASTLQASQHLQGHSNWHGNPAQPCSGDVAPVAGLDQQQVRQGLAVTAWQRWRYTAWQLAGLWLLVLPVPLALALALLGADSAAHAAALADAPQPLPQLLA
ncbi:MAG: amino acid adenylation domain-containing protein, partial [Aquabacterium sp.]|nr:amino acid adenylation domain-containing protein [Aquabacterium sp.]